MTDFDCTDGVFCDGEERCMPGATGADQFGCIPPIAANPCLSTQQCNEGLARCLTQCSQTADADGDGHRAAECGGDDCDDSDRNRFPGNVEVCDGQHDEDCDPTTVGTRDADGDGFQSNACCNGALGIPTVCGNDCDDSLRSVNPQAPEVCDGIDNNCNGVVDEGLMTPTWYPDCDGDLYGDHAATGMPGCSPPVAMPMCSMPHAGAAWVSNNRDCVDTDDGEHPGVLEICDGVDNNCDGRVDEDPAARSCGNGANGVAQCAMGRCSIMSCSANFADCDSNPSNGCEADLRITPANCGACGSACVDPFTGTPQPCVNGACVHVQCPIGFSFCGGRCQAASSPIACGPYCIVCPTPAHGSPACSVMAQCDVTCDAGFVKFGTQCVPSPRLIGPMSGSVMHTARPSMTVEADADFVVQFCSDAACATVLQTTMVTATPALTVFTPMSALPQGLVFWRAHAVGSTMFSPTWEMWIARNPTATSNGHAGSIVDFNRDGLVDVVVAAPSAMTGAGRAHVFYGTATGLPTTPSLSLVSPDSMSGFGTVVSTAGDVNGDGYSDLLVTAPTDMASAGRAFVYYGSATGPSMTPAATLAGLDGAGANFGAVAVGGFDANGDGFGDVAIANVGTASIQPKVFVFYGSPNGIATNPADLLSGATTENFGASLAAGDFNGDGFDDIAVGASADAGHVYMYLSQAPPRDGSVAFGSSSALDVFGSGASLSHFGAALALGGDLDGDGMSDLVVGEPGTMSGNGTVSVFTHGIVMPPAGTITGTSGEALGTLLASVGDIDGDGRDDVTAGAPTANANVGSVAILLGTITRGPVIPGPDGAGGLFGASIALAGDIDHDHYDDLLVGAEGVTSSGGRVYVFPGGAGGATTTATIRLDGPDPGGHFGRSLASRAVTPRPARAL